MTEPRIGNLRAEHVRSVGALCVVCVDRIGDYVASRLICRPCYQHLLREGIPRPPRVDSAAVLSIFRRVTDSGCWEYQGTRNPEGYGRLGDQYVHRISYELHVGPIPAGLVIDHLCRNTSCFNPSHLEAVTSGENIRRGESPGMAIARSGYCINGHPRTPENLYARKTRGGYNCRPCRRDRDTRRREAVTEAAA